MGSGSALGTLPISARRATASLAYAAATLAPSAAAQWQNLGLALLSLGGRAATAAGGAFRHAATLQPLVAEYPLGLASTQPPVEAARTLCLDPPVQEGFGVVLALSIGREQPALAEGQAGAGGRGEAAERR